MSILDQCPDFSRPLTIFLFAFFFSIHGCGLLRLVSARIGYLDHPGGRKLQAAAIPSSGGIALVVSVCAALFMAQGTTPEIRIILAVGVGIAVVGVLDDLFHVSAVLKLLALAVGCFVLHTHGIGLNRTPWASLNYILTFLWVAGIASSINAIDNADGLAASSAFISSLALFALGWSTWQQDFSILAMALGGATLGFLHHNMRPARLYMGDAGSFFIGYILAVLVIYAEWSESPLRAFSAGCLVLALPIYDLALTTGLRIRYRIVRNALDAIRHSDRDHTSHRLLHAGYTHAQMLAILSALSTLCCLSAFILVHGSLAIGLGSAGLTAIGLALFGISLDRRTSCRELWVNATDEKQFARPNAMQKACSPND